MKRALIVVSLLLLGQRVWAGECPTGTTLQIIGQARGQGSTSASTEQISIAGHQVRASRVSCGGTACVATLYDADTNADATPTGTGYVDGNVRDEPGAAANTSTWTSYDPPLNFVNGISTHDDGNVNGSILFECR